MSQYLCQTQEIYRVNSEKEAAALIEAAKTDNRFTLLKSSTEYKTVKAKGEIVDEYWKVTLVKYFTDLKEPDCNVSVEYSIGTCFPSVNEVETNED